MKIVNAGVYDENVTVRIVNAGTCESFGTGRGMTKCPKAKCQGSTKVPLGGGSSAVRKIFVSRYGAKNRGTMRV